MYKKMIKSIISQKDNEESLNQIFYPKSIALIGASNNISKIGGYIFSQIKSLESIKTFPINVKSNNVQDCKAFPNIRAIEENIDLVIIVIPSDFVIDALRDCIFANVKNVIIISAGFKETGDRGKEKEEKIKKLAKENNINLIGPNCLGIINAQNNLNCSFAKDIPQFGDVALVSQSGAVIDGIIDWSFKYRIGFSKIVSLGNMAGISELDILRYLGDDDKTNSIVFYMETLDNGSEFAKVLKEVSKKKPVIIIKPGKSKNAQNAIGSHTGSLAQDNILVETLIKENNGIFVNSLNELFDVLIALNSNFNGRKNLAILTNAGGPGVIATDILDRTNFNLYKFSEEEKSDFYDFLPVEASLNNPIDILGDAKSDRYQNALEVLERNPNVDNILVLLTPQIMTDNENIAKSIVEVSKRSQKNIFSCFLGDKEIKSAIQFFDENNFANFSTPIDALVSQNYLLNYKSFEYDEIYNEYDFDNERVQTISEKLDMKKGLLDYEFTKEVLDVFGIEVPKKIVITSREQINNNLIEEDKNYVLKGDAKELVHKKDVGGVLLGINRTNFEEKALGLFDNLERISKDFKITLEEEVKGTETIIGLKSDSNLGNFIMFGFGGTYVSVIEDVNFSSCPLTKKQAQRLVEKSKVNKILKGFRGSKPIHFEHLYELLVRMSYLQEIFPQIKEVDLNPVICNDKGVFLVDVKLIL